MPNDYAVKSKGIIKTSSTGIYPSIEALFGPWNSFEEFRTYLGSIILKTVTDSDIPNGLEIGIKQSNNTLKRYKWTNPNDDDASWVLCDAVESVNGKTGAVTLTKSDIGLGNVDNTPDANKNVNSAVKDGSGNNIASTYETKTDAQAKINALTKTSVGLENVDNTADNNKVVKGANEDGSGNVISATYETKADATTKQTGLQTAISAIQTTVNNLVGLEGTNYAGFSVDTTEADALAAIPTKYTTDGYTNELVWYLVGDGIDNLKAYSYDGTNTPVLVSSKVYDFTDFSGVAADVNTLSQNLTALGPKIEQVKDGLAASFDANTGTSTITTKTAATFTDGKYMTTNGTIGTAATLEYTQHIPVEEGMVVCGLDSSENVVAAIRFVTAFDGEGNAVAAKGFDGAGVYVTTYTVPSGIASVVLSFQTVLDCQKIQTSKVQTITTYSIKDNSIGKDKLDNEVTTSIDNAVESVESISEDVVCRNLLDKNAQGIIDGKYMTTVLATNENMMLSAPIKVDAGATYVISGFGTGNVRFVSYLANASDTTAESYTENVADNGTFTVPSGVSYIRVSISKTNWAKNIQIEKGSTPTQYQEYFDSYKQAKLKDKQVTDAKLGDDVKNPLVKYSTALGNAMLQLKSDTLSGALLELTDFPKYIKKSHAVSVSANISTFGAIEVGLNSGDLRGSHIRITDTLIYFQNGTQSGTDGDSVAHGLTISSFIKVAYVLTLGKLNYVISTLGGFYKGSVESDARYQENYGHPYIKAESGTSLTNVSVQGMSQDLRLPVWVIGDSYTSIFNDVRWTAVMLKDFGFTKWMLQGIAGGTSAVLYADLVKSFAIAKPKYLVWCLGMNDGDTSSSTPNTNWLNAMQNLIAVCQSYGITLILATIPMGTNINNEAKNAWVKASGYRYIDFAKAVHGETYTAGTDNWYEGYNADGTHPTALGAQALASQVLVDFPEIMQYD